MQADLNAKIAKEKADFESEQKIRDASEKQQAMIRDAEEKKRQDEQNKLVLQQNFDKQMETQTQNMNIQANNMAMFIGGA